jgi:hypothetical protein
MTNKFTPACTPQHTHDCTACVFLGRMTTVLSRELDLYFCPAGTSSMGGSLVARFGNDGPDYTSIAMDIYNRIDDPRPFYKQAYEAAKARGLIT